MGMISVSDGEREFVPVCHDLAVPEITEQICSMVGRGVEASAP